MKLPLKHVLLIWTCDGFLYGLAFGGFMSFLGLHTPLYAFAYAIAAGAGSGTNAWYRLLHSTPPKEAAP